MANAGLQLLGYTLAFLGFIGLIASTSMAEWKMSSYAGDNIITSQAMYEGLWKACVYQSTGQMQCKVYDSLLQQPGEVQTTRGLMISSIFLGAVALMAAAVGMKCTTCLADNKQQKSKVALAGGVLFILAGVLALAATSWYGEKIRRNFFDPFTPTNSRYEFGKALYVGWGASALTLIGGSMLSCNCGSKAAGKSYPPPRAAGRPGTDHV
ncbi:Claudin-1 Senescence-associated epithelial membrane protein [Triplophysa tibetana]|uniref:Claudin n=1 Tax=Triplophysa tibetana TaxID=1572043 RepID=A0A5A9P9L4_9TELE|nr:Claudin-1 Senescence-associated epithelial membrane protein [Triplophysa tibetana]